MLLAAGQGTVMLPIDVRIDCIRSEEAERVSLQAIPVDLHPPCVRVTVLFAMPTLEEEQTLILSKLSSVPAMVIETTVLSLVYCSCTDSISFTRCANEEGETPVWMVGSPS